MDENQERNIKAPTKGAVVVLPVTTSSVAHDLQALLGEHFGQQYITLRGMDKACYYALSSSSSGVIVAAATAGAETCWPLGIGESNDFVAGDKRYLFLIGAEATQVRLRTSSFSKGEAP